MCCAYKLLKIPALILLSLCLLRVHASFAMYVADESEIYTTEKRFSAPFYVKFDI